MNNILEDIKKIKDNNHTVKSKLIEIYSEWLYYDNNFKIPLIYIIRQKLKNYLPLDDGGGPVNYDFINYR